MALPKPTEYHGKPAFTGGVLFNLSPEDLDAAQMVELKSKGWIIDDRLNRDLIKELVTFHEMPTDEEISFRVDRIFNILNLTSKYYGKNKKVENERLVPAVLLGGDPFFASILDKAAYARGMVIFYSFRKMVNKTTYKGGKVKESKCSIHKGFIQGWGNNL